MRRPSNGRDLRERVRQALHSFLAVPIIIVVCFVLGTVLLYFADGALWPHLEQLPDFFRWLAVLFGERQAVSNLLTTLGTGLITVTSITFSLLLIAVQQGGMSYTNQVFDQFLRRRANQFYFGYFVGLSIFVLFSLVTANGSHRPILAALAAIVMTGAGLFMVVVLIYLTIVQIRPHVIVDQIRQRVLNARKTQLPLLGATRRTATPSWDVAYRVRSEREGYITQIDASRIRHAVTDCGETLEVLLSVHMGDYVAFHDELAELRCPGGRLGPERAQALGARVAEALCLDQERDLDRDPDLGLEQLATIGWTTISTAHSNPLPGVLTCRALRDIIARWSADGPAPEDAAAPIVYSDIVLGEAIAGLETFVVVAHESMQHQTLAEILRSFAILLPDLAPQYQEQVAAIVMRSLSTLGEHVLTSELDQAISRLVAALRACGRHSEAGALEEARQELAQSIGHLGSRSTRVPNPS